MTALEHPENLRHRVYCTQCGTWEARRHGLAPLGWEEMAVEGQPGIALCPDCVRRNLWLMESRLNFGPGSGS